MGKKSPRQSPVPQTSRLPTLNLNDNNTWSVYHARWSRLCWRDEAIADFRTLFCRSNRRGCRFHIPTEQGCTNISHVGTTLFNSSQKMRSKPTKCAPYQDNFCNQYSTDKGIHQCQWLPCYIDLQAEIGVKDNCLWRNFYFSKIKDNKTRIQKMKKQPSRRMFYFSEI